MCDRPKYIPEWYISKYGARAGDQFQVEWNRVHGYGTCERCGGTGNEFYSMYRACKDCDGTGRKA